MPRATTATSGMSPADQMAPVRSSADANEPLVSVVMAAYNARPFIEHTCRSVLAQRHACLELIVVDDGSTDGTGDVVAALGEADSRVRLLTQSNSGVAAARNAGIAAARGAFVAPIDSDDIWAPAKLERQVRRLREAGPDAGLAYCWWAWIDQAGHILDRSPRWEIEGFVLPKLVEVNFTGNASVPLFRRAALDVVGGYSVDLRERGCQGCEDWDLALRVAERFAVAAVPAVLVGYRRRRDSMSAACETMWQSQAQVMRELAGRQSGLTPAAIRRSRGQFALHLAGVAFWSGQYLEAVRWALRTRSLTLTLAVLPHVTRLLARRIFGNSERAPTLYDNDGHFDAAVPSKPLIPYDRIYDRRWRRQDRD